MDKKEIDKIIEQEDFGCRQCRYLFRDYIDGKLDEKAEYKVVTHINNCKYCADEIKDFFIFLTALDDEAPLNGRKIEDLLDASNQKFKKIKKLRRILISMIVGLGVVIVFLALLYIITNF